MSARKWETPLLLGVLGITGLVAWVVLLRPPPIVDASSLDAIPLELGSWHGHDVPVATKVAEMLDADRHVQRTYEHSTGAVVWLYIGYYGTERGGRPEHTPWMCYPSNGWTIQRATEIALDRSGSRRANELLIEKAGQLRLVHFWYQSSRRDTMLGAVDQAIDRFMSRLLRGRADGSLVRLSTPLVRETDEAIARARLLSFADMVAPSIASSGPAAAAAVGPVGEAPGAG